MFTVVHSAHRPCPGPDPNCGLTAIVPVFGNGLQFMEKAFGGTTDAPRKGYGEGPVRVQKNAVERSETG